MRLFQGSAAVAALVVFACAGARADDGPQDPPDEPVPGAESPDAPEEGDAAPAGEPESPPPVTRFTHRVLTDSASYLSDEVFPYDVEGVPQVRPRPLFEIGDPFQGQGFLNDGIELPTGAVWNPSILVFGTFRSAIQTFNDGRESPFETRAEWANRLDLFLNLRLSATERFVLGLRPMDDRNRGGNNTTRMQFTGWEFQPRNEGVERFNGDIRILFFEGDFGELFPNLDPSDDSLLDVGFAVGRQPLLFQDGVMINGTMDAAGITHNNIHLWGSSKLRLTAIYAMPDMIQTTQANRYDVVAFQTETDTSWGTIEADIAYRNSRHAEGSGIFYGIGIIQRIWKLNNTLRWNGSAPIGRGPGELGNGHVIINELSMDLPWGNDLVYLNTFLGIDRYQSAFRDGGAGGPLGRVGILFAAPGIGRYSAPLSPNPYRSWGGALGTQFFFGKTQQTQLVLELGMRSSIERNVTDTAMGAAVRVQQGLFGQLLITAEAFFAKQEKLEEAGGGRLELLVQF